MPEEITIENLDKRIKILEEKSEKPKSFKDIKEIPHLTVLKLWIQNIYDSVTKTLYGLLTDVQKTDLTDGGETTLHTHPSPPFGWELIQSGTFSGNFNIDNIDGNADKVWKLIIKMGTTAVSEPFIQFNGDGGINYNITNHKIGWDTPTSASYHITTDSANISTIHLTTNTGGEFHFIECDIAAKSGNWRLVKVSSVSYYNATDNSFFRADIVGVWKNSADNIIVINFNTGSALLIPGEYWLFRIMP